MRLIRPVSLILMLVATSGVTDAAYSQTPQLVARRIASDSTRFSLWVNKTSVHARESFIVKLHVDVKKGWRVFSSDSGRRDGPLPIRIQLPDSLLKIFEFSKIRETGQVLTRYDSNFKNLK